MRGVFIWWLSAHVLVVVAAARLTRLVTTDTITNNLRERADRLLIPPPLLLPAMIRADAALAKRHRTRARLLTILRMVTPPPWRHQLARRAADHRALADVLEQAVAEATPSEAAPIRAWRIYLVEFLHCDWCVGFWTSLAAFTTLEHYQPTPHLPTWLAVAAWTLAASYAIGRVAERLDADRPHPQA